MQEAAAAAAVAAVAAAAGEDDTPDARLDLDDAEIAEDVLEGLRRMDQGGSRVTWYVHRDSPPEREGFVDKLKTDQLDEQYFKQRFGPGEYRVFGRDSAGHYVRGSHKVWKIAADAMPGAGAPADVLSLVREMREADQKRAQERSEATKTYATILAGPVATIAAALIARRPSLDVPALIGALRPQQSSLGEMTTALASLKQMSGEQTSNVDMVLKLLERLQDLPNAAVDTGWMGLLRDVVREVTPHARELITTLKTQGPANAPPVVGQLPPPLQPTLAPPRANGASPLPAPTPTAPPPAPAAPAQDEGSEVWQLIEPWLRRKAEDLHESAATNMDVELCAEHLLQAAEKRFGGFVQPQQLYDLLIRPEWWQHVTAFYPPLAPYQAWCDDVRLCLVGMLQEDLRGAQPDKPEGAEDDNP